MHARASMALFVLFCFVLFFVLFFVVVFCFRVCEWANVGCYRPLTLLYRRSTYPCSKRNHVPTEGGLPSNGGSTRSSVCFHVWGYCGLLGALADERPLFVPFSSCWTCLKSVRGVLRYRFTLSFLGSEELHTSSEKWLQQKSNLSRRIRSPMAPAYKNVSFFETRSASRRFWVKEPRHSENMSAVKCYL